MAMRGLGLLDQLVGGSLRPRIGGELLQFIGETPDLSVSILIADRPRTGRGALSPKVLIKGLKNRRGRAAFESNTGRCLTGRNVS
jgi:hypothetical protein